MPGQALGDCVAREILVATLLLWLWMLLSCIRHDPARGSWLWMLGLFPILGGIPYFFVRWLPLHGGQVLRVMRRWTRRRELALAEEAARHIGNPHQHVALGEVLFAQGRLEHAAAAFAAALERDATDPRALWSAACVAMHQRDFARAKECLQRLLAIDPDYRTGEAYLAYGRALLDLRETDAARSHLEGNLKYRSDSHARVLFARACLDQGQPAEARRQLDALLLDLRGSINERSRRAAADARALRRRTRSWSSGVAVLDGVWRGGAWFVSAYPLPLFLLVAAAVVTGDVLWQQQGWRQRTQVTVWEAAFADVIGFDRKIVEIVKRHTGGEIRPLVGRREDGEETAAQGIQVAVPWSAADRVLDLLRAELIGRGYLAFRCRLEVKVDGGSADTGWQIGVIQGIDPYEILRIKQTNGYNHGLAPTDVIAKLREWEKRSPFEILGADFDWVEIRFFRLPFDVDAFAREAYKFCPDSVDQGTGTVEALASEIRRTRTLFLWWD